MAEHDPLRALKRHIAFKDAYNRPCLISDSSGSVAAVWLGLEDGERILLDKSAVKRILPKLQRLLRDG